jgi:LuxR family transcriptional regulator, maltose regulon positive regulatory protein
MAMPDAPVRFAKTARPVPANALPRPRLFQLLDEAVSHSVVWVVGPPGSGKTTLVADYLAHRSIDTIWYQVDASDADPATFFYFVSQTVQQRAATGDPLPLLAPESLADLENFTPGGRRRGRIEDVAHGGSERDSGRRLCLRRRSLRAASLARPASGQ